MFILSSTCSSCTRKTELCAGGKFRTLAADPVCNALGFQYDEGCKNCITQADCPSKYILAPGQVCTGESTYDVRYCQVCANNCTDGKTFISSCSPVPQCSRCTEVCLKDFYKASPCNITDDVLCKPCNTICGSGLYLKRQCSGSETSDVSQCASCLEVTCNHLPDHFNNLSMCEGNASLRLGAELLCTPCEICKEGFYEAEPCRPYANRVCKPCTVCSADEGTGTGNFQVRSCNATSDAICQNCTQCSDGYWKSTVSFFFLNLFCCL